MATDGKAGKAADGPSSQRTPGRLPRPRRSLGQNFLVDSNLKRRIVEEARVGPQETVVEIGPGIGALTEGLARRAGRLILVELDRELAARLALRFGDDPAVQVVQGDILELPLSSLAADPASLKVVGNIPYNLTTPILFHLLTPPRPREILIMVQKEVADRIISGPGCGEYGALSIGVQSVAEVERVLSVPPQVFRPQPRVDSTVIRIRPLDPAPLTPEQEQELRKLTRAVFQWRRKQLQKILRDHPDLELDDSLLSRLLEVAHARPSDRPETVAPEGFVAMARELSG